MMINLKKIAAAVMILPVLAASIFGSYSSAEDGENPLTLEISQSEEQSRTVELTWTDINNEDEMFSYQLYRKKDDDEWEPRSIWNESETVDVLNVYPSQPYLETWMTTTISESEEPAGMGLFNIDSVLINDFNADPAAYMLDEDGNWKYDVIFFGSSDANSYKDLSESSYEYTQRFADSGRGVLFGHDTICSNNGLSYFCKFADQLGILVKIDKTYTATTSASVVKIGTLTNFPWTIRGTLTVPSCHSYGQFVGGTLSATEWLTLDAGQRIDEETGAHSNFYLVTYKNLGMIQTGHSNGSATDDERKVLANTLFYLYQISQLTDAKDNSFYDEAVPDTPTAVLKGAEGEDKILSISAADNGTEYSYYISASSDFDGSDEKVDSNIVTETAISGIKGFVYDINENEETMPELVVYDENNEIVQNVVEIDENGVIEIPTLSYSDGGTYYLHAFAVDNENNVSDELIVALDDESIVEPVVTTTTTTETTTETTTTTTATTTSDSTESTASTSTATVTATTTVTTTGNLTAAAATTETVSSSTNVTTTKAAVATTTRTSASSPKTGDSGTAAGLIFLSIGLGGSAAYGIRRKFKR